MPFPQLLTARPSFWPSTTDVTAARHSVHVLKGRTAILAALPLLREFAAQCGQAGEVESMEYFLSTIENRRKIPHLLLLREQSSFAGEEKLPLCESLMGAVLLYEYRAGPAGLRVFATGDGSGRRNVLAPLAVRAEVAAQAARTLVERGAQMVQIVFSETQASPDVRCRCAQAESRRSAEHETDQPANAIARELSQVQVSGEGSWALLEREIPMYLPLYATVDETLARMGQRTRSNLRYYRRRSEKDLGCQFVGEVEIGLGALMEFNRECTFRVDETLLRWRFTTLGLAGVFLRGIRDRDGRWLSLVCGRRHHGFVEIDWQLNRADLPAYSLSLVIRAYLIEHEISEGATRLYIEGGTNHPIVHSFLKGPMAELTVKRRSLYVRTLERLGAKVFPAKNYLAQTLCDPQLEWRRWKGQARD